MEVEVVAHVRGGRVEPLDDDWGDVEATIVLDDRYDASALDGLADFSHVEVVYRFHRVAPDDVTTESRHPRGRRDWPRVGIFAQRAKARPNRIGVSVCELLRVDGRVLHVRGLDAIDGTPVVDLKPYVRELAPRGEVRQPRWMSELMREYW